MSWFFDSLSQMFSANGFVPRRVCGLWPDWLVWEHVVGNALVWLAYVAMPVMIWRLGVKQRELEPFRGVIRSFALFIALCGLGHFLDMLAFFHPMYRLSGHVLIATGLVSWWTAWSLRAAWPMFTAMKSPAELNLAVNALRQAEAEKFRQLADAMPQIVWTTHPDGRGDYFNARYYEYTGRSRERAVAIDRPRGRSPEDHRRMGARGRDGRAVSG